MNNSMTGILLRIASAGSVKRKKYCRDCGGEALNSIHRNNSSIKSLGMDRLLKVSH